jgi:eukaryotic-like serine/threonine-protein kinase
MSPQNRVAQRQGSPPPAIESGRHLKRTSSKRSPSHDLVGLPDIPFEMPFAVGEVVAGKYQVAGLLGNGGMGYVVSALHVELGELVALKFLHREALLHEQLVARFAREARAAVKIRSEHVVRVFDVGALSDGVPFIVMEHLQGKDLADVVSQQGRLPIPVAVEYVMQACEALASAHAKGIIHRDVKPENLFLTRLEHGGDVIKVLDFGISKLALSSSINAGPRQFVETQIAMGSPTYMSPEQVRACAEVDARADVWSLGCVLFELLTGTTAFDAPTLMQLGVAILESEPARLRSLLSDAPPGLEAVILRCLEKDPDKRFQNMAELATALFPFAPRRTKVYVERCRSLLVASDGPDSAPRVEMISLTSLPPEDIATLPPPALGTHMSGTRPIAAQPEISFANQSKRRKLLIAWGALLALAVAFVGWQASRGNDAADTPAPAPATAAVAPAVQNEPAAPVAAPVKAATEPPAAQPTISAPSSKSSLTASKSRARPPPKPATRARNVSTPRTEEPDVGF